jgi:multidrug efflux pump subunit AcrA (membrane-fusion protein)
MVRGWWERFTDGHRLAEFLPDAEGVIERRHSPVAGLLILVVAVVFAGVLAGSALTEVEQVVRAEGQIEPADRVKVINHPDGGRIAEVNVVEGQQVAAGAPLLSFDAEQAQTRLVELTGHWQIRTIETARLQAEVAGGDMVVEPEVADARPELIAEQQALLPAGVRRTRAASRRSRRPPSSAKRSSSPWAPRSTACAPAMACSRSSSTQFRDCLRRACIRGCAWSRWNGN